jgi:hypothetical protein
MMIYVCLMLFAFGFLSVFFGGVPSHQDKELIGMMK